MLLLKVLFFSCPFPFREEQKWRSWVDHTFVHTLSPNIYRTMKESFQVMEYITHVGNFSNFERQLVYYSGAFAMYIIGRRIKRRYGMLLIISVGAVDTKYYKIPYPV